MRTMPSASDFHVARWRNSGLRDIAFVMLRGYTAIDKLCFQSNQTLLLRLDELVMYYLFSNYVRLESPLR
jgi:hypothetical protein